jgi:BexC/CtrB/KpsE family polysaccharide export inner-membrane protein
LIDRFNPLGLRGSFEDLYKYFLGKVDVNYDTSNAITKLSVRAFNPKDAQRFNEQLLELAEATVNRLNSRGRSDLISFAQAEVDQAKAQSRSAAATLASFRNRSGIVDPEKQAQVQLQMVSKLQDELIANRTQLAELRRYAPANPQVVSLQARIGSLQQQINQETGKVAGNQRSIAGAAAEYQRLLLESQFADKQLGAAMNSLVEAQNEARRKQAYVERISRPNLPDDATEPRRLRGILATFILGLVAWGVLSAQHAFPLHRRRDAEPLLALPPQREDHGHLRSATDPRSRRRDHFVRCPFGGVHCRRANPPTGKLASGRLGLGHARMVRLWPRRVPGRFGGTNRNRGEALASHRVSDVPSVRGGLSGRRAAA